MLTCGLQLSVLLCSAMQLHSVYKFCIMHAWWRPSMCVLLLLVLQILEVMCDDSIALCLSPQAFSNVNPATDIYNNTNKQ